MISDLQFQSWLIKEQFVSDQRLAFNLKREALGACLIRLIFLLVDECELNWRPLLCVNTVKCMRSVRISIMTVDF